MRRSRFNPHRTLVLVLDGLGEMESILHNLSRRDERTQPGVLTPGTRSHTMTRPEGAADSQSLEFVGHHGRQYRSYHPFRVDRFLHRYLGLKPQAAVATLWRALTISLAKPKDLAATKALRSRAESFNPFGISPSCPGGTV